MKQIASILIFFIFSLSTSQERKKIESYRFQNPPKIDGKLIEQEWNKIKPADGFTLFKPETKAGEKIPSEYESKVYVGYDNNAIYIGAVLKHPNPKEIPREFGSRDKTFNNSESFYVSIDTYDDKFNSYGFIVTSSGTIADLYRSGEFRPSSLDYDTVFDAKVDLNNVGWSLEIIIPYSAIRFPKKNIQSWGINFVRRIIDLETSRYAWNAIDEKVFKEHESMGLLTNIKNIEPPTRLFFYPYLQSSINFERNLKPSTSYKAGLDLKYGLNNSFTLDLTLIPDFGQVSFDNKELNLSPFEQQFTERRAFFTEGSDLFKKADVGRSGGQFFYSRRIGQEIKINENDYLNEGDELLKYDEKSNLINSVKITGTTDKKLSIGFLNAITSNSFAYIIDNNKSIRKELVEPSTNFNIISLSQQLFNDYSSISILNTNINRKSGLNGNNSVVVFDIYDDNRKYNIKSLLYNSYAPKFSKNSGFRGSINLEELRGNYTFGLGWSGVDEYYNQNELGFYNLQNSQQFNARIRYKIFEENKNFISYSTYLYHSQSFRFNEFFKTGGGWRFGNDFVIQNLTKFEADFYYRFISKDYYETRELNRYIIEPVSFGYKIGFDTYDDKIFSYGMEYEMTRFNNKQFDEKKSSNRLSFNAKYRLSEKISISTNSQIEKTIDDVGYLQKKNNEIHFGIRNVNSVENSIEMNYNINNNKNLSLRIRNFWSTANYDEKLFNLLENGMREITDYSLLDYNPNTNFNLWNLDLKFEWWFSLGSTIILNYKNQIFDRNKRSSLNYYKSLKNLFEIPIEHQLSLRINYLIDANKLKRK